MPPSKRGNDERKIGQEKTKKCIENGQKLFWGTSYRMFYNRMQTAQNDKAHMSEIWISRYSRLCSIKQSCLAKGRGCVTKLLKQIMQPLGRNCIQCFTFSGYRVSGFLHSAVYEKWSRLV